MHEGNTSTQSQSLLPAQFLYFPHVHFVLVTSEQLNVATGNSRPLMPTAVLQAPVVAHANDLVYWDSNNARALVNARGMEYQNHWGAHDPDVELPSEQLNAFFGTRAEYWTPAVKPASPQGGLQQPSGHLQQRQGRSQQPSGQAVAQAQRVSDGQAGKGLTGAVGSQSRSAMGNVRAQRAADRAHNEAVIASTDEQLAQTLADEEAQVSSPHLSAPPTCAGTCCSHCISCTMSLCLVMHVCQLSDFTVKLVDQNSHANVIMFACAAQPHRHTDLSA